MKVLSAAGAARRESRRRAAGVVGLGAGHARGVAGPARGRQRAGRGRAARAPAGRHRAPHHQEPGARLDRRDRLPRLARAHAQPQGTRSETMRMRSVHTIQIFTP